MKLLLLLVCGLCLVCGRALTCSIITRRFRTRTRTLVFTALKLKPQVVLVGSSSYSMNLKANVGDSLGSGELGICIGNDDSSTEPIEQNEDLAKAMRNARNNAAKNSSPGAGLDAFEAAEAAYADLINTSMDHRNIDDLSEEELAKLSKGGTMWESEAKMEEKQQPKGIIGNFLNILGAVGGGAQIVKNEYGET